ncbi:hypothetical protein TWF694_004476 [Orbilia ellipsospora]|uniref:F-box domain-containing protein n=1 Tax=Orbilia ellipsospora TaxID=2528407 RepID=A0AAV9WW76_9PEZI
MRLRSLPLEVQFMILEQASWDQHAQLAGVCRSWRNFVMTPAAVSKRYTRISVRETDNDPIRYFERPRLHQIHLLLRNYVWMEQDGRFHPCFRKELPPEAGAEPKNPQGVEPLGDENYEKVVKVSREGVDLSQFTMLTEYAFYFNDPIIWPAHYVPPPPNEGDDEEYDDEDDEEYEDYDEEGEEGDEEEDGDENDNDDNNNNNINDISNDNNDNNNNDGDDNNNTDDDNGNTDDNPFLDINMATSFTDLWFIPNPNTREFSTVCVEMTENPTAAVFFENITDTVNQGIRWEWGDAWNDSWALRIATICVVNTGFEGYSLGFQLEPDVRGRMKLDIEGSGKNEDVGMLETSLSRDGRNE